MKKNLKKIRILLLLCLVIQGLKAQRPSKMSRPVQPSLGNQGIKQKSSLPLQTLPQRGIQTKHIFSTQAATGTMPSRESYWTSFKRTFFPGAYQRSQFAEETILLNKQKAHEMVRNFNTFLMNEKPQYVAVVQKEFNRLMASPLLENRDKHSLLYSYNSYISSLKKHLDSVIERGAKRSNFTAFLNEYWTLRKNSSFFTKTGPITLDEKRVLIRLLLNKYIHDVSTTKAVDIGKPYAKRSQIIRILGALGGLCGESPVFKDNREAPLFLDTQNGFETITSFGNKALHNIKNLISTTEGPFNE